MSIVSTKTSSPHVRQGEEILDRVPFGDQPRAMDKLLVAMCVVHYNWPNTPVSEGGGVTVPIATNEALQHSNRDLETDQQFVRRFFDSEWVDTFRESSKNSDDQDSDSTEQDQSEDSDQGGPDNDLWAAPNERLVNLLRSLDNGMSTFEPSDFGGLRDAIQTVLASGIEGDTDTPSSFSEVIAPIYDDPEATDSEFARERVQKGLSRHVTFLPDESHQYRREVFADQLRIDVEGRIKKIQNGEKVFNRFTSRSRAADGYRRIKKAFENAARMGYRKGTEVVLTTTPRDAESHEELVEKMNNALTSFLENQRHRDAFDATPERVGVVEHADNGLPHVHLIFFGVSPDEYPVEWATTFWSETKGLGREFSFQEVGYDRDCQKWVFPDGQTPPAEYYTKYSKMMMDIAEGGDPLQLTREGGEHWKLALLWGSDEIESHERISKSLRGDVDRAQVHEKAPDWVYRRKIPHWLDEPELRVGCEQNETSAEDGSERTQEDRDEWLRDGIPLGIREAVTVADVEDVKSRVGDRSRLEHSRGEELCQIGDQRRNHLEKRVTRELSRNETQTQSGWLSSILNGVQQSYDRIISQVRQKLVRLIPVSEG